MNWGLWSDLDKGIAFLDQAVKNGPGGSNCTLPHWLGSLADGLLSRVQRTQSSEDLDRAIKIFEQAVNSTTEDNPVYAQALSSLGQALGERYTKRRNC